MIPSDKLTNYLLYCYERKLSPRLMLDELGKLRDMELEEARAQLDDMAKLCAKVIKENNELRIRLGDEPSRWQKIKTAVWSRLPFSRFLPVGARSHNSPIHKGDTQ